MHLHPTLSSTALTDSPNFSPVQSFMLSSHLFVCLSCSFYCPLQNCLGHVRVSLDMPVASEFALPHYRKIVMLVVCIMDLITNHGFVSKIFNSFRLHRISMASILLSSSAVRVQLSRAYIYRKVDKMSVRISLALEAREMFLSLHKGFSLERANVVWAILESISGLDSSSAMTDPRYLKLFIPYLGISLDPSGLFVIILSGQVQPPSCTLYRLYPYWLQCHQLLLPLQH